MGAVLWKLGTVLIGSPWMARLVGELPAVGAGTNKGLIHSKTIYGLLVLLAPLAARGLGWRFDDAALQAIAEALDTIAGALLIIYGRVKASRRIG